MASQKKRRKLANQVRKQRRSPTGPFVHADGDRRHRGAMQEAIRNALAQKRMQEMGLIPVDPENP